MLSGTGLGDDPLLAHFLCQQDLSQHVVNLVRTGVVQILPLQVNLAAAQVFGHPVCIIEHGRSAGVIPQQCPVLLQELRIVSVFVISFFQLMHCIHDGFRHILSAELSKSSYLTHDFHLV